MSYFVYRQKRILRDDVRNNRTVLYLFGDNMRRTGLGGQAKEMRGETNTIGVPTKWAPSNRPDAFFSDEDFDHVFPTIAEAFSAVTTLLVGNYYAGVVIPADGLGTSLAGLEKRAPKILAAISEKLHAIEQGGITYG